MLSEFAVFVVGTVSGTAMGIIVGIGCHIYYLYFQKKKIIIPPII